MASEWRNGFCIAAQSDAAIESVLYLDVLRILGAISSQVVPEPGLMTSKSENMGGHIDLHSCLSQHGLVRLSWLAAIGHHVREGNDRVVRAHVDGSLENTSALTLSFLPPNPSR